MLSQKKLVNVLHVLNIRQHVLLLELHQAEMKIGGLLWQYHGTKPFLKCIWNKPTNTASAGGQQCIVSGDLFQNNCKTANILEQNLHKGQFHVFRAHELTILQM